MKKLLFGAFLISLIFLSACSLSNPEPVSQFTNQQQPVVNGVVPVINDIKSPPVIPTPDTDTSDPIVPVADSAPIVSDLKLPATFDIDVPFVSQAPTRNWSLPYQEACEEASLINVSKYFKGEVLNEVVMDNEIKKAVTWQQEKFGLYSDTNAAEVITMAQEFYGLKAELVTDVSIERIKTELVKGNLIVAPFAGRLLGNKFYSGKGPIYHMLVIRGYDRDNFLTNDVGIIHGAAFKFKQSTIINAIHDLPLLGNGEILRPYDNHELSDEDKATRMLTGSKVMIVLSK